MVAAAAAVRLHSRFGHGCGRRRRRRQRRMRNSELRNAQVCKGRPESVDGGGVEVNQSAKDAGCGGGGGGAGDARRRRRRRRTDGRLPKTREMYLAVRWGKVSGGQTALIVVILWLRKKGSFEVRAAESSERLRTHLPANAMSRAIELARRWMSARPERPFIHQMQMRRETAKFAASESRRSDRRQRTRYLTPPFPDSRRNIAKGGNSLGDLRLGYRVVVGLRQTFQAFCIFK